MRYVRLTLTLPQANHVFACLDRDPCGRYTARRNGLLSMLAKEIAQQSEQPKPEPKP